MKNQRPYLFDAIYRWIIDNGWTPHLLVDANALGVEVPLHLIQDGRIVLNINPSAIANFYSEGFGIGFSARFSGKSQNIVVPYPSMIALFSKEGGQGMVFPAESFDKNKTDSVQVESVKISEEAKIDQNKASKAKKPSLKLIK